MQRRRLGAALTALALLFTMVVGIAGASDLTPGPLVQVSGTSPFLGCTADAVGTQSGTVYLNSEVEPSMMSTGPIRATWSASSSRTAGPTAARVGSWPA